MDIASPLLLAPWQNYCSRNQTLQQISGPPPGAEPGIFIWGGQVVALIYLSKQPPTYTYTHAFLLYTYFFI